MTISKLYKLKKIDFWLQCIILLISISFVLYSLFFDNDNSRYKEFNIAWAYLIVGVAQTLSHLFFSQYPQENSFTFSGYKTVCWILLIISAITILLVNEFVLILFTSLFILTPLLAIMYLSIIYNQWQELKASLEKKNN